MKRPQEPKRFDGGLAHLAWSWGIKAYTEEMERAEDLLELGERLTTLRHDQLATQRERIAALEKERDEWKGLAFKTFCRVIRAWNRTRQLKTLLREASSLAAGAWISAALSPESGACDEYRRDFKLWFDWLERVDEFVK